MLEARNAGMKNFTTLYNKANADQKLRDRYEYLMSIRLEEKSGMKAIEDAQAKKNAMRMYQLKHMSPEDIAEVIDRPSFLHSRICH